MKSKSRRGKQIVTSLCLFAVILCGVAVVLGMKQPKEEASIQNNGHNYVKYENSSYFWKYNTNSYEKGSVDIPKQSAINQLICMDSDGNQQIIYEGKGAGPIFLSQNRIYLQDIKEEQGSTIPVFYSLSKAGKDRVDYGSGTIKYIDDTNENLIYSKQIEQPDKPSQTAIYALDLHTRKTTQFCKDGQYLGTYHNRVYYRDFLINGEQTDYDNLQLKSVTTDGRSVRLIAKTTMAYINENSYGNQIMQFEGYKDNIYISFGYSAGTANIYTEGRIFRVKPDGTNLQVLAGKTKNECAEFFYLLDQNSKLSLVYSDVHFNEENYDPKTNNGRRILSLEDGTVKPCTIKAHPTGVPFEEEGAYYIYPNHSGERQLLITKEDYKSIIPQTGYQKETDQIQVNQIEAVGQEVFYQVSWGRYSEKDSIGWRSVYHKKKAIAYHKNLATGVIQELYHY